MTNGIEPKVGCFDNLPASAPCTQFSPFEDPCGRKESLKIHDTSAKTCDNYFDTRLLYSFSLFFCQRFLNDTIEILTRLWLWLAAFRGLVNSFDGWLVSPMCPGSPTFYIFSLTLNERAINRVGSHHHQPHPFPTFNFWQKVAFLCSNDSFRPGLIIAFALLLSNSAVMNISPLCLDCFKINTTF